MGDRRAPCANFHSSGGGVHTVTSTCGIWPYTSSKKPRQSKILPGFRWERPRLKPDMTRTRRSEQETASGTFFREVHPGSEKASQNDQNKENENENFQNHGESWRFAIGAVRCVRPHALLGAATGLVAHFRCGLWGWLANVHSRRGSRACVARIDRRVTGEQQVCLRTTR